VDDRLSVRKSPTERTGKVTNTHFKPDWLHLDPDDAPFDFFRKAGHSGPGAPFAKTVQAGGVDSLLTSSHRPAMMEAGQSGGSSDAHLVGSGAVEFANGGVSAGFVHDALPTMTMADEIAFISGVSSNGLMPADAFYGWNGDTPATYTGGFTDTAKWGANTAGAAGGTIAYYFNPSSNWTATEQTALIAGLALWSDVANISFVATTNLFSAQITFTRGTDGNAQESAGTTGDSNAGKTGTADLLTMTTSTISIDTSVAGFGPINGNFTTDGGYPTMTLLHEEGHAIGLGHAGPYNGDDDPRTQQFSPYDTLLWSIMSYIDPTDTTARYYQQDGVTGTGWQNNSPTGLMPLDILAAQALYGLPTTTPLSGGQTFGFNCNITGPSEVFFDFTKNTKPILTLWDAGLNNTLDLTGFAGGYNNLVNLNAGTFSSVGGLVNNLAIAFGTVINNYVGGYGTDIITANSGVDHIEGGGGGGYNELILDRSGISAPINFTFYGAQEKPLTYTDGTTFSNITHLHLTTGAGDDQVTFIDSFYVSTGETSFGDAWDGGAGVDTAIVDDSRLAHGPLTTTFVAGVYSVTSGGALDTFTHVENFNITTGAYNDILATSSGNDTFNGGLGSDTVVYSGAQANYAFNDLGGGVLQVVDLRTNSPDGTDTLTNVEKIQFSDGVILASSFITNTPPVFGGGNNTILAAAAAYSPVHLNSGLTVADTTSSTLSSATITISSGYQAGDFLYLFNPVNGITATYDATTHALTLIGQQTLATYQTALDTVLFGSSNAVDRTITVTWSADNGAVNNHVSSPVTTTVNLSTAPVITGDIGDNVLNGTVLGDHIYGLAGNDTLDGGQGDDVLIGGPGDDVMMGGLGNDVFEVTEAGDRVLEVANDGINFGGTDTLYSYVDAYVLPANVEILWLEGNDHTGIGNAQANTIYGSTSDDVILGGGGGDTLIGGTGNDIYEVRSANDQVVEAAGAGTDQVYSYVDSYVLPTNVEILWLEGSDHTGIGNAQANTIYGSTGDDVILGKGGADLMVGGAGNDIYEVTEAGDQVVEAANAGVDQVYSYVDSYVLPTNVEILWLEGADHTGVGNAQANTIYGSSGDDLILGGGGGDTLAGGLGNDIYEVRSAGDQVVEQANAGTDTVYSYVDGYQLAANVEILWLEGAAHTGIGNASDNTLYGSGGDDSLDGGGGNDLLIGGAGADIMIGGTGNDIYEVRDAGDQLVEQTNAGTDTVYSYVDSYVLAANVEILWLEGSDHTGVGNAAANTIYGSSGDDVILGGGGGDTLVGGAGSDVYEVRSANDQVVEAVGAGADTIYSYVDAYVLAANVETLWLEGNDHTGIGNAGDNFIYGAAGNDSLTGGLGNDTLTGGAGADSFLFTKGDGNDTITDFNPAAGGDVINLHNYGLSTYANLTPLMSQAGSDVVITFDASNHLTLSHTLLSQLSSGDFTFS
jgi:Ca2+-binding RTX toxin-like protein